jgi:hypothetical protein
MSARASDLYRPEFSADFSCGNMAKGARPLVSGRKTQRPALNMRNVQSFKSEGTLGIFGEDWKKASDHSHRLRLQRKKSSKKLKELF